ncbi:MAG: hypothetical protein N3C12_13515 [Candidatus Binatia bacterium]|nr:hypothetical protein [Candidatus Binatia bacterium]
MITFLGIARADDRLLSPVEVFLDGTVVYERTSGSNFSIVVEARPGGANTPVGVRTFQWDPIRPDVLPDLAVVSSTPLGNGSLAVCDDTLPVLGGVPAWNGSLDLPGSQQLADVINDLACRFKDGSGQPRGRNANEACTLFDDGQYRFAGVGSTVQFCGFIDSAVALPVGAETRFMVRVRDEAGRWSSPRSMVVRVR